MKIKTFFVALACSLLVAGQVMAAQAVLGFGGGGATAAGSTSQYAGATGSLAAPGPGLNAAGNIQGYHADGSASALAGGVGGIGLVGTGIVGGGASGVTTQQTSNQIGGSLSGSTGNAGALGGALFSGGSTAGGAAFGFGGLGVVTP